MIGPKLARIVLQRSSLSEEPRNETRGTGACCPRPVSSRSRWWPDRARGDHDCEAAHAGRIIAIDLADAQLEKALEFGADVTINNGEEDAVATVMELTGGLGADVAVEAVGVPDTFELCTELIRPGGRVANVGVHGKCVTLHLEKLWIRGVMITTGLVDTRVTPTLLRLIEGGRLDPTVFATHHFALVDTEGAYATSSAQPPRRRLSRSCCKRSQSAKSWSNVTK
jgi:hypothetical protein